MGQLPTRTDLLKQKYDEDRAKGLSALNQRYLDAFRKELDLALEAKKLDEANVIQVHIKSLQLELDELKKAPQSIVTSDSEDEADSMLVGKSIAFPHNSDLSKLAYISFHPDGEARWLGMQNQSVPRRYKRTGPRTFAVWWPERSERTEYEVAVNEDGKTAVVKVLGTGDIRAGTLEKTK